VEDRRYGIKVKRLLESPETMAMVLYIVLSKKYGEEWLSWEPLTIYLELREDYSAEPAPEVIDRISAVQIIMTTSSFYDDLYGFMGVCNTLASGSPSFSMFDPVTTAEAVWAVTEVGMLREPEPYAPTIIAYMKKMLEMDGLQDDPPEILSDVIAPKPDDPNNAAEYADMVLNMENKDSVEQFVDDQIGLIVGQLSGLGLDDEFMALLAQEQPQEV
jgi:hypothetical protein